MGEAGAAPVRHLGWGIVLGLAAAFGFATSGPLVKGLFQSGWTPLGAVFVRTGLASVILAPLGLISMRGRWALLRGEWPVVVGFGVLSVAVSQVCYFAAVQRMPVGISLLIEYLAPVLLVGLAWVRTRLAPPRLIVVGSALAVVGLVLVVDLTGGGPDLLGVAFALMAAVGAASYYLLSAIPLRIPTIALSSLGLLVGTVALGLAGLLRILPFRVGFTDVELLGHSVAWWVPMGIIVVAATAFPYVAGVIGITHMGERLSSFVGLSEVLFAVLLAWLVLSEVPTGVQVLGGILIVAGVVGIRLAPTYPPPTTATTIVQTSIEETA